MSEMRFTRWLAGLGVVGGVAIALGLTWLVLVYGSDLSGGAKVSLIILGLGAGTLTATISAVVGITIPSTVSGTTLQLDPACCEPEGDAVGRVDPSAPESTRDH